MNRHALSKHLRALLLGVMVLAPSIGVHAAQARPRPCIEVPQCMSCDCDIDCACVCIQIC